MYSCSYLFILFLDLKCECVCQCVSVCDYIGSMFECYSQCEKVYMCECAPWMVTRPARAPYKCCNYYYYEYFSRNKIVKLTVKCHIALFEFWCFGEVFANFCYSNQYFQECRWRLCLGLINREVCSMRKHFRVRMAIFCLRLLIFALPITSNRLGVNRSASPCFVTCTDV